MKNILLGLLFTVLFYSSASAQKDSTQVLNQLNQVELKVNNIESKFESIQTEIFELNSKDQSLHLSVRDLMINNQVLVAQISRIDSLLNEGKKRDNSSQRTINMLLKTNLKLSALIDSLQLVITENREATIKIFEQLTDQKAELNDQISENRDKANQQLSKLSNTLSKNTLYWVIAILIVCILSVLAFIFLRRTVSDNQSSINVSLSNTRKELEQEAIHLDEKLVSIMETQLKVIQEERSTRPESLTSEKDHSLALKVADEIIRIEKNISQMDAGTKGLKQLSKAVERIKDNFASNGYEMVDLIGKPFKDGLKCTANFRPDDSLNAGERIITRIIKPQVNYNGEMIQSAQIEVSQGE